MAKRVRASEAQEEVGALGTGVYVHWPFCLHKCPYCDFNSHVRDAVDEEAFLGAYIKELDHYARQVDQRDVSSVFFGGGTPSLMSAHLVEGLIDAVASRFSLRDDAEITLEANPTSVEAAKFQVYRTAGVNRLSIGVQSLRDEGLRSLGRQHDVKEALAAIDLAAKYFDRYSFDLIYAREGQGLNDWAQELREAVALGARHMSLYQLTVEPGTALQSRQDRGTLMLPQEDEALDMFQFTRMAMEDAGLPAYEISNHAAPGEESRHNLIYWLGGQYIGLGPGAHGRLFLGSDVIATANYKKPERWLMAVDETGTGQEESLPITAQERGEERVMMGLRLASGLRLQGEVEASLNMDAVETLSEEGFLVREKDCLKLSSKGTPLLNEILRIILCS